MAEPTDAQITAFIALMDHFCLLKGWSLPIVEIPTTTTPPPRTPPTITISPPPGETTTNTPSSDPPTPDNSFIHPSLSLQSHLDAQYADLTTSEDLGARLKLLATYKSLVAATSSRLFTQFSQQAPPPAALISFPNEPLTRQLAYLRRAQHYRAFPPAWKVNVVVTIMPNGYADNIREMSVAKAYNWTQAQEVLERTTCSWQSREAGHPRGYETGPWGYQTVHQGLAGKVLHELNTAEDYRGMIARLSAPSSGKGGKVGVCIWHTSVYNEMRERRASARRCQDPEDEPRDSGGNLIFDPEFEDGCLGTGEWDLGLDLDTPILGGPVGRVRGEEAEKIDEE